MGVLETKLSISLLTSTVILCMMPPKNLQLFSSATVIPSLARTNTSSTFKNEQWEELKMKCRFGTLLYTGKCQCRNARCMGFEYDPVCMKRDSGKHKSWPNACYMIEHACNARKKRLYYWSGECKPTTEEAREVRGEYCERDDVTFCHNDGICKYVNEAKDKRCICKRGFRGRKCESRSVALSRKKRYRDALRFFQQHWLRLRSRRSMKHLSNWRYPT